MTQYDPGSTVPESWAVAPAGVTSDPFDKSVQVLPL